MSDSIAGQFSVTCWPGSIASAWGGEFQPGIFGLSLRLDPADILLVESPFPDGRVNFARWCRQLSRAAEQVADELDPANARADDRIVVIHRFLDGQPFAVEIRPNATASVSRSVGKGVTSIQIKEPRRVPLTIVLPEEVADQIFGVPVAEAEASTRSDAAPGSEG